MSGGGDTSPVEEEFHREEHRDQKTTDSKQPGAKFRSNILIRTFDDNRSVGSGKSGKPLLATLSFQNTTTKVVDPIGEVSLSDDYPLTDKAWSFWITEQLVKTTSCRNMRNVTSNVSTRVSVTKMLLLIRLEDDPVSWFKSSGIITEWLLLLLVEIDIPTSPGVKWTGHSLRRYDSSVTYPIGVSITDIMTWGLWKSARGVPHGDTLLQQEPRHLHHSSVIDSEQ